MAADLVLAANPQIVDRSADPAGFVVQACERAKAWLTEALEHGEIEQIAEIKSQAEAVRVYTAQKQRGQDAQLAAAEVVRRAERGIAVAGARWESVVAIRVMYEVTIWIPRPGRSGTARSAPMPTRWPTRSPMTNSRTPLGRRSPTGTCPGPNVVHKIRQRRGHPPVPGRQLPDRADRSPEAVARRRELIGQFAATGMSSRQIGERLGIGDDWVRQVAQTHGIGIRADAVLDRTRQRDPNWMVRETVHALEGPGDGCRAGRPAGLDPAEAAEWAVSMARSIRVLSKFVRHMKETIR